MKYLFQRLDFFFFFYLIVIPETKRCDCKSNVSLNINLSIETLMVNSSNL